MSNVVLFMLAMLNHLVLLPASYFLGLLTHTNVWLYYDSWLAS